VIVLEHTDTGFGSREKSIKTRGREIIKEVQVSLAGERRIPKEKKNLKTKNKKPPNAKGSRRQSVAVPGFCFVSLRRGRAEAAGG